MPDGRANLRGVGVREVTLRKVWVAEHDLWMCNLSSADLPPARRRGWWATRSQQQHEEVVEREQRAGGGGGGSIPNTTSARTGRSNAFPVFYLSSGCRVGRTVELMLFEPR